MFDRYVLADVEFHLMSAEFGLREDEVKGLRTSAAIATRRITSIGDITLRRSTIEIERRIEQFGQKVYANNRQLEEVFGELFKIIMGGGEYSLLAKVEAVMFSLRLAHKYRYSPEGFYKNLSDAIITHPFQGDIILSGALYTEALRIRRQSVDGKQIDEAELKQIETKIVGPVKDINAARRLERIRGVCGSLTELISEDRLRMGLPSVIVNEGGEQESEYETGTGYPKSIMYLGINKDKGRGFYVSTEKLIEATRYGMPEKNIGENNYRLPRIILAVETNLSDRELRDLGNTEKVRRKRRLTLVYLRPIRRTELNRQDSPSFDSLTFIGAVRLVREMDKVFLDIDRRVKSSWSQAEVIAQRQKLKKKAVDGWIKRWLTDLDEKVQPLISRGKTISPLDLALMESTSIDGEEWTLDQVNIQLAESVRRLALQKVEDRFLLRKESDMMEMYRSHIWNIELSGQDRAAMTYAMLADRQHPIWKKLDSDISFPVRKLDDMTLKRLFPLVEKFLVLRCETIRDRREPEGLRDK